MGNLSIALKNALCDVIVGRAASYSTSGQVWAQLHTGGDPGTDGTAHVAPGFSRQLLTWGTPANRQVVTTNDLLFSNFSYQETGSPYITLWDSVTGGNYLAFDQVTPVSTINIGQSWLIPTGAFKLSFGTGATGASDALAHRILAALTSANAFVGSGVAPYMQPHTGDPGSDGTANVAPTGSVVDHGTGASGREQTRSFPQPPNNGIVSSSTTPANYGWQVRSSTGLQLGIMTMWDAATAGNYLGKTASVLSSKAYYAGDVLWHSFAPSQILPTTISFN